MKLETMMKDQAQDMGLTAISLRHIHGQKQKLEPFNSAQCHGNTEQTPNIISLAVLPLLLSEQAYFDYN